MTTGKTIALTRRTFVGKVMSLSRLVTAFLPRSKSLLISWLQSPSAVILEPPKNKVCHCFNVQFQFWTWNNRLVPKRKRSTSRLYTVPCLFNLYAEYIMRNTGLDEAQLESRLRGEISTSDMQITPPLRQKAKN